MDYFTTFLCKQVGDADLERNLNRRVLGTVTLQVLQGETDPYRRLESRYQRRGGCRCCQRSGSVLSDVASIYAVKQVHLPNEAIDGRNRTLSSRSGQPENFVLIVKSLPREPLSPKVCNACRINVLFRASSWIGPLTYEGTCSRP